MASGPRELLAVDGAREAALLAALSVATGFVLTLFVTLPGQDRYPVLGLLVGGLFVLLVFGRNLVRW